MCNGGIVVLRHLGSGLCVPVAMRKGSVYDRYGSTKRAAETIKKRLLRAECVNLGEAMDELGIDKKQLSEYHRFGEYRVEVIRFSNGMPTC